MPIDSVHIGNFKGVSTVRDLELRPITVFVGANSSGKSSCIHALAALSQTVRITNDTRPLVLDDEFASVHLGRFIEIIHSKSYEDAIELGINFGGVKYKLPTGNQETVAEAKAILRFKSTVRTQEMYLESADWDVGTSRFKVKRVKADAYTLTADLPGGKTVKIGPRALQRAFFIRAFEGAISGQEEFERFMAIMPFLIAQETATRELVRTLYLGPFRQSPLRRYPTRGGDPKEVGSLGEATVTMLANEMIQTRNRTHIKQVTKWLETLGLAKALDVTRVGSSDLFDVSMTLEDGQKFPLADLGYGLSQVLPVLAQCSFAPEGATLLFEQPEIHLHSLVATKLADVFIETAKDKGAHVVLETHSPQLAQGFMVASRAGKIAAEDFVIYKVCREDGESVIKRLNFDECGEIDENWEKGISID